jgi:antitoxin (DNA-binding transcriptional repressor) of toxin-antitoxin stability system
MASRMADSKSRRPVRASIAEHWEAGCPAWPISPHRLNREATMETVNIHEAKTQCSKLSEAVGLGQKIMIAKAGKPAAMLVPVPASKPPRTPGALKGKMRIADNFDAPLPDHVQAAFEGR